MLQLLCTDWRFYAAINGRRFFIKKQTILYLENVPKKSSKILMNPSDYSKIELHKVPVKTKIPIFFYGGVFNSRDGLKIRL